MDEILKFLTECKGFFVATDEGEQPRVRPFGFAMGYEGKMYFATSKQKPVYKQLAANPKFEICACGADMKWVRVCGNAVFDDNKAAKEKCFEVMPPLKNSYKGGADDPDMALFYISGAQAQLCSMTGPPKTCTF